MSALLQLGRRADAGRRVVLVDLPWGRNKDPRVPLGHASLLAALAKYTTADVRSVVMAVNDAGIGADDVVTHVLAECAGANGDNTDVAIGVYVWSEALVQKLIAGLRGRGFAGRIILGGPQISFAGPGVDQLYPGADVFIRGYGEQALCDVVSRVGRASLPGVHHAGQHDDATQAAVDLEALPSPWLDRTLSLDGLRFVRWETQRGCPFRCSFCQHREPGARLRHRELDHGRVAAEAELLARSGVEEIAVLDPIFNASAHAADVLDLFARHGFTGLLSLQCRAEMIDARFLDAASRLRVRLEFGLQTIHEREGAAVLRRNHVPKVDAVLAEVQRRGLDHEVTLIFGLPEQTLASFLETVTWCLARRVPVIRAFPLMLLRGTELDRQRERWGLVDDGTEMAKVVSSNTFDERDWSAMARVAEALARTEGQHPANVEALLAIARDIEPALNRWQPAQQETDRLARRSPCSWSSKGSTVRARPRARARPPSCWARTT